MAWFGTKFEQNCWKIEPGLSAYSSQQQEKAERQQKTSRVQLCSNLVPNHFTGLSVAPRSLTDSVHCVPFFSNYYIFDIISYNILSSFRDARNTFMMIWHHQVGEVKGGDPRKSAKSSKTCYCSFMWGDRTAKTSQCHTDWTVKVNPPKFHFMESLHHTAILKSF